MKCKKRIKAKLFFCFFAILTIVVLLFIYFEMVVNPMVVRIASAKVDSVATTAISDAIYDVICENELKYSDFVNISYDSSGNITSITSNVDKMNLFARDLSTKSQIYLDNIGKLSVNIPLGAFTGLEAFSSIGPEISLKMLPIGSVITSFRTSFDYAGINQTRHSIYVDASTILSVILPTSSKKLEFVTSALVCESVIVGKVPSVYLGGN